MKIKQIFTTILLATLFLCMMPVAAFAVWGEGNTLEDALSELDVNFDATKKLDWLYLTGLGPVEQRYTYFLYKDSAGALQERPVFCVDPTKGGAYEIVSNIGPDANGDDVATYIRGEKVADTRYMQILYSGYPHMTLESLGLQTIEEGYYATKVALWMYVRGNDPTKLTINPAYSSSDPVALRVHQAAVKIYNDSQTFPVREPKLTMTGKPSATANLDTSGQYYVQTIEVYASGWIGNDPTASGNVELAWESQPPAGTIVLGTNGEDITSTMQVTMNAVEGVGRFGTVTVKYPAAEVDPETFSPPALTASALLPNNDVYVAYAKADKDRYQRYIVEGAAKIPVKATFVSQIYPETPETPNGSGLRIIKLQTGTNIPLRGAVFEVLDPDGKMIFSGATPANGVIDLPLAVMGNYTVTELSPPQYHLLSGERTQSITVSYGSYAEVTFVNDPYGTLRVMKRDAANGNPLSGAAIQIRNIVTNATQEGRTDSSGNVIFTELPVGAYEIVEITSPDGYALDSSVHTVNVLPLSEGETSYTITNKAKSGLRIIKYDRQTMDYIDGVTFEIWKDGELYGTYVTDDRGEIMLPGLPAGTYTAREIATREPYVLDTTAQWIEIADGQGYISELVFLNLEKPGIRLMKIDSQTFAPLVNAKFLIKQVGGSYAQEHTTDQNGEIDLAGLEPDTYTVQEIIAPNGYLIDDSIRTIKINAGENAQFVFTNTKKPTLEVLKYDGENYIPGATFRIALIKDGSHYLDRVTDINGRISIEGLEPGIYSVQEIQAPPGYILNEKEYHVELFPGRTSQLVVENIRKPSLEVWKYDELIAKPLPDTEFSIAKKDSGSIIYEGMTNSEGFIRLENLDAGWYTVTEMAPPPGYLPGNTSTRDVYLEPGKTITIKFDNIRKPTLVFLKTNALTGKGIPGATFKVEYEMPGGGVKPIGSFKTNSDGRIIIPLVEPGWYILTETLPASGYSLPKNPVSRMYVNPGQNAYLAELGSGYTGGSSNSDPTDTADLLGASGTVEEHSGSEYYIEGEGWNWPLNSLVIKKTHAITGELLAGAAFELYRADEHVSGVPGTNIGRYTTDNSGVVVITGLEPGYYVVKEVQAPQNFLISENSQQNGYLKTDGTSILEFTFANYPYGALLITKVDAQTGQPLSGARFKVTDNSGAVVGNSNGEYSTDNKGEIFVPNVKPGSYVVTEIAAPVGYAIDTTPQPIEVGTDGKTYKVSFQNQPSAALVICKLDSQTKEPLQGAEFKITDSNGAVIGNSNGLFTTNANGLITVPQLPKGSYVITETKAPSGYVLEGYTQTIAVDYGQSHTLDVYNTKMSGLQIIKIDATTKQPLKGAKFTVYKMNGEIVGSYETNGDGVIILDALAPGWYKVAESKAPDGYILDDTPQDVEITSGQFIKLVFEDKALAGLLIIKTDAVTKKPLAGVKFEIKKASGEQVGIFTTDSSGRIYVSDIAAGKYVVVETAAQDGYIMDSTAHEVTVYEGKQAVLEVKNEQMAGLRVIKIDSISKKPIYNVEFMVFDMNNKVVGTYYTDNNGVIDFTNILPEGRYTIRETRAADGYYLDEIPKTIELVAGKVTEIRWENVPQMAQIQILKKSGEDNEVNGLPAGTPLAGAIFEAYEYKSGNMVDRFVSGSDGRAVSAPLPLGRYIVKEVQAPQWYRLSTQTLDVDLEFATQIVKYEFLNYPANTGITIRKTGPLECMPGDTISYTIKEVQNTSTVQLTDFYWRDTLPTDAVRLTKIVTGTYNQALKYKVLATTNKGDSIIIADNLSTTQNNVIECANVALGLGSDEYVTSFTLVFGTVKAGFAQVVQPQVFVKVLPNLTNQYQFANKADVGGKYGSEWVVGNSTWLTTIYAKPVKLPRTGF